MTLSNFTLCNTPFGFWKGVMLTLTANIGAIDANISVNEPHFHVDNHHILKNNIPFEVKGVVYVPGYPVMLPWDIEKLNIPAHSVKE